MSKAPNPLAFPSGDFTGIEPNNGMTLRDKFAESALPSVIMLGHSGVWGPADSPAYCARRAYEFADAMLAERRNGGAA